VQLDLRSSPLPALTADDHARGPTHARAVIFYGDLSCPDCALAHARLRDAPVRLVYRHFVLRSRPRALALALLVEAAAYQGAFWDLHDAIFEDQAHSEDPHLWEHARRLGLDLALLQADRRSPAARERVAADVRSAMRGGIAQTPTLVLDGRLYPGVPDEELLRLLGPSATLRPSPGNSSHEHPIAS
jgi:protein-disulfide isomerase